MTINSCTVNQHGQNMLQLQLSISCPVKRQAIGRLLEENGAPREAGIILAPGRCRTVAWRAEWFWSIRSDVTKTVAPDEHPLTLLESALRYQRVPLLVLLVLLPLVSWMWIAVMARDMYGPMTGASAWMMTVTWDVPHLLLLW